METRCVRCGRRLTRDDIGLYRRLVNRGAEQFLCIDCLARHFRCPRRLLEEKIVCFKRMGCPLFG